VLDAVIAQSAGQTSGGVPAWATAAIGAGGLVVGIVASVVGNWFVVRAKIRQAEVLYRQKLADSYLATAREYTRDVYVPLNILLSKLADAYLELREHVDFETSSAPPDDATAFKERTEQFIAGLNALVERGADAFLTTDVEARLRDFRHFLDSSMDAESVETKMVIQTFLSAASTWTTTSATLPAGLTIASRFLSSLGPLSMPWARLEVHAETLAAPIGSRKFEARFSRDLGVLKESIKLVTLGSKDPI